MLWIERSKTSIGAVVMLPAQQRLNKDFFSGTILRHIVECRPQNRPTLTARGTLLHHDDSPQLISAARNMMNMESKAP
jgi:hypothetical protein